MHELSFDHEHPEEAQLRQMSEALWGSDQVQLQTVGIDIGSSTSHLMFAKIQMRRQGNALSSRFVIVRREVIWKSPIRLTPYRPDYTIDSDQLGRFVDDAYRAAGISRSAIDSGAVILTGEALKRHNARAIADLFSAEAGKFVCASAGHHLEAAMAAHGSGAVRLSGQRQKTVLNVDIGGGTTKLSLIRNGEIVESVAIAIGGRLLVADSEGRIVRLEDPIVLLAADLGIALALGHVLSRVDRARIVARMTQVVFAMIEQTAADPLIARLLVTDGWKHGASLSAVDTITFSGGVAEFLYGREKSDFDDLGADLAHELRHALGHRKLAARIWDPGEGIRATVTGAANFSVQVSGNTIFIANPEQLPVRNLAVVPCQFELGETIDPAAISTSVRGALARLDLQDGERPFALSFNWSGASSYDRLFAVASGIARGVPATIASGMQLALLIDDDIAKTFGRIFHTEVAPGANVVVIDSIDVKAFDYVDIGEVILPANVVPVIIKSLLF
jgi:ethanolamine utilization protein EutA